MIQYRGIVDGKTKQQHEPECFLLLELIVGDLIEVLVAVQLLLCQLVAELRLLGAHELARAHGGGGGKDWRKQEKDQFVFVE